MGVARHEVKVQGWRQYMNEVKVKETKLTRSWGWRKVRINNNKKRSTEGKEGPIMERHQVQRQGEGKVG